MKHIKSIFLLLFLCLIQIKAIAQEESQDNKAQAAILVNVAEEILKSTTILTQARETFENAALLDPENVKANYKTGELYLETSNKGKALSFLLKAQKLDPNYTFHLSFQIGQAYQYASLFKDAIRHYNLYTQKLNSNLNYRGQNKVAKEEVERNIQLCKNGIKFKKYQGGYKIVKINGVLNSEWSDFAPTLNADENVMIFTSKRLEGNLNMDANLDDGFYFEEIFISRKTGEVWSSPVNIGEGINTKYHDSNLNLSADGNTLYLYRDGDIYYSELKGEKWSDPKSIDKSGKINTKFSENSMAISPSGHSMIFSSDRPNSIGGLDLFIANKDEKGDWSRPTNLGSVINTPYDDDSPFLDFDGKTLFFSSKGHNSMGGFDMFRTEYDSSTNEWSKPINLGFPVNTPDNDSYFVTTKDGKRGYFSSARENGMGYEDLYMIYLPEKDEMMALNRKVEQEKDYVSDQSPLNPEDVSTQEQKPSVQLKKKPKKKKSKPKLSYKSVELTILLKDFVSEDPLAGSIKIRDLKSKKNYTPKKIALGKYQLKIKPSKALTLRVEVNKTGYTFNSVKIPVHPSTKEAKKVTKTLFIEPLRVGTTKILRHVYFKFGSSTLDKVSYPELNTLYNLLKGNTKIIAEIAGHSDKVGSKKLNQEVSELRAQAIVRYLVKKGISKKRLKAIGYGESRPLASNDDENEGRELNRRVEVKILGL